MKNLRKVLALVLAVATLMSFAAMATAADFSDAAEISKDEAVEVLVELGVINGMGDGTFDAKGSVTRAQMAKMISVILNSGKDVGDLYATSCTFTDMDAAKWAKGYVAYCANKGIINGRDAKTFDPNGKVTATEAAKMILCALGYDANNEGLTGDAWSANTVNLATDEMNLFKGVKSGLDAAIDRETAAQMLLNGLLTDMVKYEGGSKIEVAGVTFIQGAELKPAGKTLLGKYFPKASRNDDYYDNFGRPGVVWTNAAGVEMDPIIDTPVLTSWGTITAAQIYKAVGVKGEDIATILVDESDLVTGQTQHVRSNGKALQCLPKMGSGHEDEGKAWGVAATKNEVYYNEETNTLVYIALHARLAEVVSVDDDKTATLNVWYSGKQAGTVANSDLKEGDFVLGYFADATRYSEAANKYNDNKGYTAWANIPMNADEPMFEYVVPASKTVVSEGGVKTSAGAYTTIYTDLGTYSADDSQFASGVNSGIKAFTVDEEYTLYFTENGKLAGVVAVEKEEVKEEVKYAYVLASTTIPGVDKEWPETGKTADTYKAQILFADGSVEIQPTDKQYTKDALYTYTVNSKGLYVLNDKVEGGASLADVKVVNGKATIDGDLYANSKTTFVVASVVNKKTVYTVYTGIKAVPTMEDADIYYVAKDNKISLAFVLNGTAASDNATYLDASLIYLPNSLSTTYKDGKVYVSAKAIVEGTVKTLKLTEDAFKALKGKNLVAFDSFETNADGFVTKMNTFAVSELGDKLTVAVVEKSADGKTSYYYKDGIMNLNGKMEVVDETVKAYIYNAKSSAMQITTINKLTEKFSGVAVMDGETIVAVYGQDNF